MVMAQWVTLANNHALSCKNFGPVSYMPMWEYLLGEPIFI
jgi:hypothetical protein